MAKPLIPVEAIYEHALELLDAEGSDALTTRRLAADLKISTRTLYQQVGSREELVRALVARHFSQLRLDFHEYEDWETTGLKWCLNLRDCPAVASVSDRVDDYRRPKGRDGLRR